MAERFFEARKLALYTLLAAISLASFGEANVQSSNPKEALMLRRITEYWKDGDYATVKRQVIDFLEKNPNTPLHDHLHAMLGDLYFQERNFRQALATYDLIGDPEIRDKTFFNHLQAHFELRDYLSVVKKAETYLKESKGANSPIELKVRYLLAEAAFRQALNSKEMDQKIFYLKIAKPHYKILTQTKYSERALFPLAEIHRLLREDERAASLYLSLAQKYPEHRERFLFQAAILQIKDNKQEAINTFEKVHEMGGKRSRLAAFNQLILLYQSEKYEEFLAYHQKVIALMPDDKVPLLNFYEGRCYYYLGDYNQAVMPLENYVTNTKGRTKELKTAYLLLVNCSRYTKDVSLLERTLFSYKSTFPKDNEVPKVLMIHAQMCRESGDFAQALSDLKTLMSDYPNYQEAEEVMYDYALLLSQMDKWMESKETFLSFLDKYPKSKRKNGAWRHLLNCSIEEIKNPSQPSSVQSKESFVKILQQALEKDKILNEREKQQYSLVLMKCQCELERYEQVIPMLSQYLVDTVDQALLAEAHLLMAICQQRVNSDLGQFILHAEKALSLNPKLSERNILHLELFNAYLTKGLTAQDQGNRDYFYRHAASHLFASNAWKDRSIKLDNYLWLVNHFYQLGREGNSADFEKARILFHDLLGIEEGKNSLNIASDSLYLEAEVLKYAHLLEMNHRRKDQISVLEMLVRKQEELSQLPWKLKRRAVLELARAYEMEGEYQNALNSYRHLVKTGDKFSSMVTNTAQLHLAKLEYNLLKPQQRNGQSPEVISILHTLKDLQIQKKLTAEPLHLEAALRYAEIRGSLSDSGNEAKNGFFFYKRMYEDFNNKEDPLTEEYTLQREKNPDKDAIFNTYMRYLDGQMLKTQAEMARADKQSDKSLQLEEEAVRVFDKLLQNEESLKPYLLDRVKRAKVELAK